MRIFFIGKAAEVAARLKAFATENRLLTAEQFLQSLARERRAIAALAGQNKVNDVAGGATFGR